MSTTNRSSFRRISAPTFAIIFCAAVVAFTASPIVLTQSRIEAPPRSTNSNRAPQRASVATLRASDSAEGSRVALSADQSLNDYEAYRRGDRFYVRIPAAEVPRPEAVRGRAFGDVKVQRGANDTVVSFRLQPGATARVEQRGNKLDVVFTMPGGRPAAPSGRDVVRNDAGPATPADSGRRNSASGRGGPTWIGARNANDRTSTVSARPTLTPRAAPSPSPTQSARPSPGPTTSVTPRVSTVVSQQRSSPSATTAAGQSQTTAQGLTWNNVKQRARYWILLAQLNPVPVGIGAAVLLLGLGLLILQRRRVKAARRAHYRTVSKKPEVGIETQTSAARAEVTETETVAAAPAEPALPIAGVTAPAREPAELRATAGKDEQHQRVTRAGDEVKKLMAGGAYDESIIASEDRYTRQLVGAELLSALVGRNIQRRERARTAFMNHGYFDDATRDLRTAESPNERAAAARRLSFVHDREATPHLIAALEDSSPDVRRAAVEALMDLRDPAAIAPLSSLINTESDRRVPRSLLKHAIEACATSGWGEPPQVAAVTAAPEPTAAAISQTAETEREVIEI